MTPLVRAGARRVERLSDAYRPDARAAGVFRIVYATVALVLPVDYTWTGSVPREFVHPGPGLQLVYEVVPPHPAGIVLQVLHYVTAAWVLLGWRTKAASVSLTAVTLFGSALVYSYSKVDHLLLFEVVPVVMCLAGWGSRYSIDARERRTETSGFPLVVFSVVIGFSMLTAAVAKWRGGWWDPHRYGAWNYVADAYFVGDRPGVLAGLALHHTSPLMWKLVDWGTLFAEGWVFFAAMSAVTFRAAVLILPVFHVSVYLMLGINFAGFAFVYGAFFLSPPRLWFPSSRPRVHRPRKTSVKT